MFRGLRFLILVVLVTLQVATVLLVSMAVMGITLLHMEDQARASTEHLAEVAATTMEAALDPERPIDDPANLADLERLCEIFATPREGMRAQAWLPSQELIASWPPMAPERGLMGAELAVVARSGDAITQVRVADDGLRQVETLMPIRHNGTVGAVLVLKRPLGDIAAAMQSTQRRLVSYVILDAFLVLIIGYILLSRMIVRPIEQLVLATQRIADGDLVTDVAVQGPGQMGVLAQSFNRMLSRLRAGRSQLVSRVAELAEANARLETAQQEVVRSERLATVGRLAAGVAHEVGNPLSAIMGLTEVLEYDLEPADRADTVERIQRELRRIDGTIRDLLDYARPGAARPTPLELSKPVEAAVRLLTHHRRGRSVEVTIEGVESLPPVLAVEDQIVQVLLNLLLNAADAMQGQGGIRLVGSTSEQRVEVRIHDRGPGIPQAVLPRIFDPFFTTKEPGVGTGLGLAICERVVASLGGTLRVESTGPEGTTVLVELPVAERPMPASATDDEGAAL
jgi:two-component system NtrC family sensor kinase